MPALTVAEATARLVSLFPADPPAYTVPPPTVADTACGELTVTVSSHREGVPPVAVRVTVSPADVDERRGDLYDALRLREYCIVQEIQRSPSLHLRGGVGYYRACGPAEYVAREAGGVRARHVVTAPGLRLAGLPTVVLFDDDLPGCRWAGEAVSGERRPYRVTAAAPGARPEDTAADVAWLYADHAPTPTDVADTARRAAQAAWLRAAREHHAAADMLTAAARGAPGLLEVSRG